jgi:ABC-type nickel/cobalt efflux system permease component RcnA/ABC-type uncharacterized transport system substrate-binding protein
MELPCYRQNPHGKAEPGLQEKSEAGFTVSDTCRPRGLEFAGKAAQTLKIGRVSEEYPLRFRALVAALIAALVPAAAHAHPHEWIDVAAEVLFDKRGRIAAIRHHWRFDEAFSAFALQGLDTDGDGAYSRAELMPLAEENVQSLAEYGFFTFVSAGDYVAGFAAPENYRLDLDENRLTLHFTLPLAVPLFTRGEMLLQVYDPEYYIAFSLPSSEAVRLVDAPAGCRLAVTPAQGPDAAAAAALATIGPEQRELPPEMQDLTGGIDNSAAINCGGPTVAAAAAAESGVGAAANAEDAARVQADAAPSDLTAMPAEPADNAPDADPAPPTAVPSAGGFTARLAALQSAFSQQLTEALKGLKADGSVFWWLGGLSFLYGIVHAAGPGHGKVVISSYLLANEERVRRGVAIAFLAALVQALVAIGIVGFMAALLDMTGRAMTRTAGLLETGSFALVTALGLYLLARKGRAAWSLFGAASNRRRPDWPHGGAHSAHVHTATCGCHHHVPPAALDQRRSGSAAAAVLSVGIRPCSGALVVLVFALAQGIFWAGIASTFLMALGTAIAVAALAALAVGAKGVAQRLARGDGSRTAQVMLGLEVAAALLITVLGAALFLGSLSA